MVCLKKVNIRRWQDIRGRYFFFIKLLQYSHRILKVFQKICVRKTFKIFQLVICKTCIKAKSQGKNNSPPPKKKKKKKKTTTDKPKNNNEIPKNKTKTKQKNKNKNKKNNKTKQKKTNKQTTNY